jgi:hypothetical protein
MGNITHAILLHIKYRYRNSLLKRQLIALILPLIRASLSLHVYWLEPFFIPCFDSIRTFKYFYYIRFIFPRKKPIDV